MRLLVQTRRHTTGGGAYIPAQFIQTAAGANVQVHGGDRGGGGVDVSLVLHRLTIAEGPLPYSVLRCKKERCAQHSPSPHHHGLSRIYRSLDVHCRYVSTPTCRMSTRVHKKPHVNSAELHRITIAEGPLLFLLCATM